MNELNVSLTTDQKVALEGMLNWTKLNTGNNEDLFCVLTGFAGVGKTFLLKYFVQVGNLRNFVITAPTHKAKKVASKATDFPSKTIQSLLGLRPDVNMEFFDINKPVFNPLADETIKEYRYVFVDECSMIGDKNPNGEDKKGLFTFITNLAIKYKIRIIFTGDKYQALPINEGLSKVFKLKHQFNLTTPVRQNESNPNLPVFTTLRKDIDNNTSKFLLDIYKNPSKINELGEGYLALNPNDFTTALVNQFCKTEALYDVDYIKYIAYTNKSVSEACRGIRNKRIGTGASELIVKDDFLIGYNTIVKNNKDSFYTVLENSEDYTIDSIQDVISDFGIKCYGVNLKDSENNNSFVYIVKPESYSDFLDIFRSKLNIAKERRGRYWEYYYTFKNEHLLMEDFYFPNGKIEVKKDLYYGYGLTSHKAQGSTYNNVAVNIKNMLGIRNINERNRLIYVALSRTSKLNILNI